MFNYSFDTFRDKQRGQTTTVSKKRDNGLYDVSLFKTLSEEDLRPETVFGCVLTIPGTDYSIKEETMYFPGKGIYYIETLFIVRSTKKNGRMVLLTTFKIFCANFGSFQFPNAKLEMERSYKEKLI